MTAKTEQAGSALSASGICAVLKRFFRQAAKSAANAGLDAQRFEKANTHWMRHTFVRQALVDGVPIEVASEMAGHAGIDTTSIIIRASSSTKNADKEHDPDASQTLQNKPVVFRNETSHRCSPAKVAWPTAQ